MTGSSSTLAAAACYDAGSVDDEPPPTAAASGLEVSPRASADELEEPPPTRLAEGVTRTSDQLGVVEEEEEEEETLRWEIFRPYQTDEWVRAEPRHNNTATLSDTPTTDCVRHVGTESCAIPISEIMTNDG